MAFRSTVPPPESSFFGRPRRRRRGRVREPGEPAGGSAMLHPYFSIDQPAGSLLGGTSSAQPFADPARTAEVTTPWVMYPDLVEGECVQEGGYTYLELTVDADPDDPRTDDIPGDLTPEWGMHLVDANVAMGDIEAMVREQAEAFASWPGQRVLSRRGGRQDLGRRDRARRRSWLASSVASTCSRALTGVGTPWSRPSRTTSPVR